MYNVAPPIPLPPGAHDRQKRLHARVVEVFGDRDITWLHRWDPACGLDETGAPNTPHRYAAVGEEQLQTLLARLDELAKTVTPRWEERSRGRRKGRRRGG